MASAELGRLHSIPDGLTPRQWQRRIDLRGQRAGTWDMLLYYQGELARQEERIITTRASIAVLEGELARIDKALGWKERRDGKRDPRA